MAALDTAGAVVVAAVALEHSVDATSGRAGSVKAGSVEAGSVETGLVNRAACAASFSGVVTGVVLDVVMVL